MKLHLICSVILALAAGSAMANRPDGAKGPGMATPDPLAGAVPEAETAVDARNPLTGRSLSIEKLEKELELQKKTTALLEERLRQHGIRLDAQNLATKKEAEMSSFRSQLARERAERANYTPPAAAPTEQPVSQKAKTKPKTTSKPLATPAPAAKEQPVVSEPAVPRFEVVGVSSGAAGVSVILSTPNGAAAYQNGETSPWGKVTIDAENGRVHIGGQVHALPQNAIARRQFNDPRVSMRPGGLPTNPIPPGASAAGRPSVGLPVPPRPAEQR